MSSHEEGGWVVGAEEETADVQLHWGRKGEPEWTETVIDRGDSQAGGAAPVRHQSCLLSGQVCHPRGSHVRKESTQQEATRTVSGAGTLTFHLQHNKPDLMATYSLWWLAGMVFLLVLDVLLYWAQTDWLIDQRLNIRNVKNCPSQSNSELDFIWFNLTTVTSRMSTSLGDPLQYVRVCAKKASNHQISSMFAEKTA